MTVWSMPAVGLYGRQIWDDCGTAACAAGWTARDPEAMSLGLFVHPRTGEPYTGTRRGMSAMADWLDILFCQAAAIFSPVAYDRIDTITPEEVLERVQLFLRDPPGSDHRLD